MSDPDERARGGFDPGRKSPIPVMAGEIRARPVNPGGGRRDLGQGRPIPAAASEIRPARAEADQGGRQGRCGATA
jgi:hypothetical protein